MKKTNLGDIFLNNLKVENQLKEISSIFTENIYTDKINYKPYFQREYVWDLDKATYLIESILLRTEIPPIVLFYDDVENQVIDGRQRCETIEKYLNNKFSLQEKGLKVLKSFTGMYYRDLPIDIKNKFRETTLRIIQFSIVNRKNIGEYEEDKVKKEIFKRYNSGIMPLKKEEIERAEYISDELTNKLYKKFETDLEFLNKCKELFLLKRERKKLERDKINILISKYRTLMIISKVPINKYADKDKYEIKSRYFYYYKDELKNEKTLEKTYNYIEILYKLKEKLKLKNKVNLAENILFFECLYWGINILDEFNISIEEIFSNKFINGILNISINSKIWNNISLERRSLDKIFENTGSHYTKRIIERYRFIANYLNFLYDVNFDERFSNTKRFEEIMCYKKENLTEIAENVIEKSSPISMSIEDISRKIDENRFIIRPKYQRSEIGNQTSASYLLESIMLGIKISPIYVYKRKNSIFEVIDGQQRLLSMIAFLGKKYLDIEDEKINSIKHKFQLKNLKVLLECNKKNIDNIGETYKRKIMNFQLDVIEIDENKNKNFNIIDLFLRLNIKQYPIDPNSFEMWNGYGYKEAIIKIKELALKNEKVIFSKNNKRMKVETLITSLVYLEYNEKYGISPYNLLGIFLKKGKVLIRIKSKEAITKMLDCVSENEDKNFLNAIENIEKFINKIHILIDKNHENLLKLFISNNSTGRKKDQNFYLLWLILRKIKVEALISNREEIFKLIMKIFKKSQENIKRNDFIYMIENICENNSNYILPF